MKLQLALEKIKPLLLRPSFTSEEARLCGVSSATLAYYVKKDEIKRIGRGIYRGINAPITNDFRWEDLIEATKRVKNGVVCLSSALSLYGLTEEMPSQHWIAIRNETLHRAASNTKIVRMRNLKLGKTTLKIGGVSIPIFDRERTLVDSFRYLGNETALKALRIALSKKGPDKVDQEKILKYAKILRVKIEPYLIAMSL